MPKIRIKERPIYYFIPALIVLTILAVYPILNNVSLSLTNKSGAFSLANYQRLFKDKWFWNAMLNTGKWALFTVSMEMVVGMTMAFLMNMRLKGQSLFRSLLIIPWMTPVIAICAVWKWMYNNDFGILTYAINTAFGTHLTFLSDYNIALCCLGIIYVWKRAPFIMLMYLSGMQSISEDVYEAAELDGCRGFKRLTQITLPLLFPIIRSLMLISLISSFNQFTIVHTITGGGPARSTMVIQNYIYNNGIAANNFNFGAAASTAFLVIIVVLALIYISATEKAEEGIY